MSQKSQLDEGEVPIKTFTEIELENIRLSQIAEKRTAELEAIGQVSLSVAANLDLQVVLQKILSSTFQFLTNMQVAHIFLYHAGHLTFAKALWADGREHPFAQPRPHGITYTVAQEGQPIVVPHMNTHPLFMDTPSNWEGSIASLPLKIGQRVVGVMNIASQHPRTWSDTELRVLRLLADQAAVAIENNRLYEEAKREIAERKQAEEALAQRMAQIVIINNIGRGIVSVLDLDSALNKATHLLQQTFNYHHVALFLLEKGLIKLKAVAGSYKQYFPQNHSQLLNEGIIGWVSTHGKSVIANDVATEPRYISLISEHSITRSELCLPIKVGDETVGVLDIQSPMLNAFDQNDIIAMETLVDQMAMAIQNARLYEEAQREINQRKYTEEVLRKRNSELTLLNHAGQILSSTLDMSQVFVILLEEARHLLNVIACSVWLIDQKTNELVCHHVTDPYSEIIRGWRLAPRQGLAGWVANHGESLIVPDVTADERHFKGLDDQTKLSLHSILTVPLFVKKSVIGVIQVVDEAVNRFDQSDLQLMESLAAVAANAIENAHLFTELKDTQTQLIRRERLAALGQMAATVAHELRNPLMAIRMGIEYLLHDADKDDPRQKGAMLMQANIERIDRIVENILFVARSPQPRLASCRLKPIIEDEYGRWELAVANKNIIFRQELEGDLPPIQIDADQIARVLSNLISNSLDVLPPGGEIVLTLHQRNDYQIMTLRDNGPGISQEHLPRIFDPFFTTKARGSGLGLSIVKQIIEYHQGCIDVFSETGIGTKFIIYLPNEG